MSKHFTRLIKANKRLREFNFRKLPSSSGDLYHVDVVDDRGNRLIFKMQKEAGSTWKIIAGEIPAWIQESEEQLNEALEDQLQSK